MCTTYETMFMSAAAFLSDDVSIRAGAKKFLVLFHENYFFRFATVLRTYEISLFENILLLLNFSRKSYVRPTSCKPVRSWHLWEYLNIKTCPVRDNKQLIAKLDNRPSPVWVFCDLLSFADPDSQTLFMWFWTRMQLVKKVLIINVDQPFIV